MNRDDLSGYAFSKLAELYEQAVSTRDSMRGRPGWENDYSVWAKVVGAIHDALKADARAYKEWADFHIPVKLYLP